MSLMEIETLGYSSPCLSPAATKALGAAEAQVSRTSWLVPWSSIVCSTPGSRVVCIRDVQKTLAQSAKLLIENKIQEFGVDSEFRVLYDRIEISRLPIRYYWGEIYVLQHEGA